MKNRYENLPTGVKKNIGQFNDQIFSAFNQIQDKIDDYKNALFCFMDEKRIRFHHHYDIENYLKKILNERQLIILKKLQTIDQKFSHIPLSDKLTIRFGILHKNKKRKPGGGGASRVRRIKILTKQQQNKKIMEQIFDKYFNKTLELESFYDYIFHILQIFNNLQKLINPENFIKYKDVLFIKEIIQKTNEFIDLFNVILNMESETLNYKNLLKIQNEIYKNLKLYIKIQKINLDKNI
jgi:hypothetical protein